MNQLTLSQRMNLIMKDVKSVIKDGEIKINDSQKYSVVTYDSVIQPLHKAMVTHGVILRVSMESATVSAFEKVSTWNGKETKSKIYQADVWTTVDFINSDNKEDFLSVKAFAYAFDSGDKAVGKAHTMGVKSILLKNFALESLDEEEARPTEGASYSQKGLKTYAR